MKKARNVLTRGARNLVTLMLVTALFLSSGISALALENGDRVTVEFASLAPGSYDGMNFGAMTFNIKGNEDYIGSCGQYGVDGYDGGKATVKRHYSLTSEEAKKIYYFAVVRGWQDEMGTDSSRAIAMACICQDVTGSLERYLVNEADHPNMYKQAHAIKACAKNAYDNYPQWKDVKIPSTWELVYLETDNDVNQNVLAWPKKADEPPKLRLKKSSANTGITG